MAYYLGIDVGQSSTRAALCDEQGRVLLRGKAGGYNRAYEPGGVVQLEEVLQALWHSLWPQGRPEDLMLDAIAFGMSAGWEQIPPLAESLPPHKVLVAEWDGITALRGAIGLQPGVVVISGTGAVGIAVDAQNKTERCGGWGWRIDDAGSAYAIGQQALLRAMRTEDGRSKDEMLHRCVLRHFARPDYLTLKADVMGGILGVDDVASLARLVSDLAAQGDAASMEILQTAGEELALLPEALMRRMRLKKVPVAYVGGVFADPSVREAFVAATLRNCPEATVMRGRHSPLIGALILAYDAAGSCVTEDMLCLWDKTDSEK